MASPPKSTFVGAGTINATPAYPIQKDTDSKGDPFSNLVSLDPLSLSFNKKAEKASPSLDQMGANSLVLDPTLIGTQGRV